MAEEKDDPPGEKPPASEESRPEETPPAEGADEGETPAGVTPAEEPPPAAAAEIPAELAEEEAPAEAAEEAPAEAAEEAPAEAAEEEAPAEVEEEAAPAEEEEEEEEAEEAAPAEAAEEAPAEAAEAAEEAEEEAPAEEDAEEDAEEAGEPIQYPLSFKDVLFSFRGRLNRKVYWLKGVLASFVISLVLQSVVGGLALFVFGLQMFSAFSTMEPVTAVDMVGGFSRFEKSGEGVVGLVTRDTGPAGLEVELTAAETTNKINKTVIVGTRRLRITAAKKADAPSYDMDFQWHNVPTAAGVPDMAADEGWSILEIAVSALGFAVAALMMWMSVAINIKRLHDRDRKGWWLLTILIPIIGAVGLFVYLGFLKGTEGANRFGPDPLAAEGGG